MPWADSWPGAGWWRWATDPTASPTFDAVAGADAERALCLWVNSPANPAGTLADLGVAAAWGRAQGVPVLSDECYTEFTWEGKPASIVQHGCDGVLAVHSLSKRSNLAGCGWVSTPGTPSSWRTWARCASTPGSWCPAPCRPLPPWRGGTTPTSWTSGPGTAIASIVWPRSCAARVWRRRCPAGGFYLWVPVPVWAHEVGAAQERPGAWALAEALAEAAGAVVSPGEFYGPQAEGYVRVAAVQPDERIELMAERLTSSGHPKLGR